MFQEVNTFDRQAALLDQLPKLQDTQVAWLLLSCCACPRAQYALRTLPTASTLEYATRHDAAIHQCLDTILFADAAQGLPGPVVARAQLALRHGGLGLRSAARHAPAAFWASRADTIPVLQQRDGSFVQGLLHNLQNDGELPPALALLADARASLSAVGFEPPSWLDLLAGQDAPPVPEGELHLDTDTTRGWQRAASQAFPGCRRLLPARFAM